MHVTYRNVNDAFREMVKLFAVEQPGIIRSTSRVGDVLYIQEPCTITYTHPREKVLFNQARDANPFFHVYESLWMLAGRNDIAPLAYYAANYAKQVQDGDNPNANGAYGYRWRHAPHQVRRWVALNEMTGEGQYQKFTEPVDQLKIIIDQLKRKPDSRRCVLQMWNVEDDLLKIDTSKDVCCNTCAYFSLRYEPISRKYGAPEWPGQPQELRSVLDMTVCNRSNDLIWGTLGANAVHFSFLQEYLAACIGCEVGVYSQFSNNQHVYVDRFEPEKWLADDTPSEYDYRPDYLVPLVKDPATFDREVVEFVEHHSLNNNVHRWQEPFLNDVAERMCLAFHWYKQRQYGSALEQAQQIKSDDWRIAGTNWLLKRKANYEARINKA